VHLGGGGGLVGDLGEPGAVGELTPQADLDLAGQQLLFVLATDYVGDETGYLVEGEKVLDKCDHVGCYRVDVAVGLN